MCARGPLDRNDRVQLFSQLRHQRVIIVGAAHVNQTGSLLLNRGDDFRMAMTGRAHRDAGVAVKKQVAVDVFDPNTFGAFGDQFE